jgi:cell fate (sporulation/competence/biofilm development) regulator YlbF (YheA/YmcA/DUF963 family)
MDLIWEKAREVGRLLAQSTEYGALKRANTTLSDDRQTVALLNRLNEIQEAFGRAIESGEEPTEEQQLEFERVAMQAQASPAYQAFESARANFDKLMMRINEEIAKGIEAGEQSRIILPS